jgi:hypothetical protein
MLFEGLAIVGVHLDDDVVPHWFVLRHVSNHVGGGMIPCQI